MEISYLCKKMRYMEVANPIYDVVFKFLMEDDRVDAEMQRILRRLLMAAASSEMRQDMNVEDEYYSYLEMKETEVLMKDKVIAEKDAQLSQQQAQLSQQQAQLRKSIKMLLNAGQSLRDIAENLGLDEKIVTKLSES